MEDMNMAQLDKIRAEIRKLGLESDKLMLETRWYPLMVGAGLVAAIATLTKAFL
jgi:hypothetical protein